MSIQIASMAEAASAIGVPHCRGILPSGQYCVEAPSPKRSPSDSHKAGFASGGAVHMSDRRVTRSSLRQLALLAAEVEIGDGLTRMASWKRIWLRSSIAEEYCRRRLHVRIPSQYWDLDRWTVRAQLASVDPGAVQRAEAMAWARQAR